MENTTVWQDEIQMLRAATDANNIFCAEKTDLQLVRLVLEGDEKAFEDLFERYKRLVASIAARYFRRHEQIEEIIQISFSKAFFELKYFRGERDFSFACWLGKITTNACLDVIRNQKRKPENLLCEFSENETEILFADKYSIDKTHENILVKRDLAEKLLSQLRADDRAILEMLDVEEMSVREISKITGWSRSKIKVKAFRARKALRKIIKNFL